MKAKSLRLLDNDHYFVLVVNLPIKEMDIFDYFILMVERTPEISDSEQQKTIEKTAFGHLLCS